MREIEETQEITVFVFLDNSTRIEINKFFRVFLFSLNLLYAQVWNYSIKISQAFHEGHLNF